MYATFQGVDVYPPGALTIICLSKFHIPVEIAISESSDKSTKTCLMKEGGGRKVLFVSRLIKDILVVMRIIYFNVLNRSDTMQKKVQEVGTNLHLIRYQFEN